MKLDPITATVFDFLTPRVTSGTAIIVGVSGGPDSMGLMSALVPFAKKMSLKIIVAHVNHGIRGTDADSDELFVKEEAEKRGFIFEVKRVKLTGSGLEEKGRVVRKDFFEKLAKKYSAAGILTAHTADDQCETIILNMIRGSFVSGGAGMAPEDGLYLKPFLTLTKKEILLYLVRHEITFCTDVMNNDLAYSRTFIRKKIVPLMQKLNPSLVKTIGENAVLFAELDNFLTLQMYDQFGNFLHSRTKSRVVIPLEKFSNISPIIQSYLIQALYKKVTGSPYSLQNSEVKKILSLISKKVGRKKHDALGCTFEIRNRQLITFAA